MQHLGHLVDREQIRLVFYPFYVVNYYKHHDELTSFNGARS